MQFEKARFWIIEKIGKLLEWKKKRWQREFVNFDFLYRYIIVQAFF